jgi:carbon storage regulator
MLVLTRKLRESVVVGASQSVERMLTVTVLAIRGGQVKLGFVARPDLLVHRWEVWERLGAGTAPKHSRSDPLEP